MNPINKNAYFGSREAVGIQLADQLEYLKDENVAILAVSPGGLIIASEIAKKLNTEVSMLQLKHVDIPGGEDLGVMNYGGDFTYTQGMTHGEIEEYNIEYRNSIDASKFDAMHKLHVMGGQGEIKSETFSGKYVIIVSDMARTGTSIKAALDFLKPADTKAICMVVAVALSGAIDIMHQYADKVFCLHATDKEFGSDHYFADNSIPNDKSIVKLLSSSLAFSAIRNKQP
jgi:putative phosphoribosyl transferase